MEGRLPHLSCPRREKHIRSPQKYFSQTQPFISPQPRGGYLAALGQRVRGQSGNKRALTASRGNRNQRLARKEAEISGCRFPKTRDSTVARVIKFSVLRTAVNVSWHTRAVTNEVYLCRNRRLTASKAYLAGSNSGRDAFIIH